MASASPLVGVPDHHERILQKGLLRQQILLHYCAGQDRSFLSSAAPVLIGLMVTVVLSDLELLKLK